MKKEYGLALVALFIFSLTAITGVNAIEEGSKSITITKKSADVTGDGQNEIVMLKGFPYQGEEGYLKKIELVVMATNSKKYNFPLESGSKAALQLIDLNHDGIKDLFATVETGGSGGISLHYLYTLKDFHKTDLKVPEPLELETKFMNDYRAEMKILATGKTYLFDLKDRKKYYKKLGLYYNGNINEPTELHVNPFNSLIPIILSDGTTGLKGMQRVTGIANADTIAYVESIWRYSNNQWNLLKVNVNKAKN
ncbi:hypothetical protein [Bacillus sp. JJ1764]|uniref:hypothetical protein n=1 Tax=Bacillus sp. JJ1764 TaxID=3122964 RepID=UPI002FFDD4D3